MLEVKTKAAFKSEVKRRINHKEHKDSQRKFAIISVDNFDKRCCLGAF